MLVFPRPSPELQTLGPTTPIPQQTFFRDPLPSSRHLLAGQAGSGHSFGNPHALGAVRHRGRGDGRGLGPGTGLSGKIWISKEPPLEAPPLEKEGVGVGQ